MFEGFREAQVFSHSMAYLMINFKTLNVSFNLIYTRIDFNALKFEILLLLVILVIFHVLKVNLSLLFLNFLRVILILAFRL